MIYSQWSEDVPFPLWGEESDILWSHRVPAQIKWSLNAVYEVDLVNYSMKQEQNCELRTWFVLLDFHLHFIRTNILWKKLGPKGHHVRTLR